MSRSWYKWQRRYITVDRSFVQHTQTVQTDRNDAGKLQLETCWFVLLSVQLRFLFFVGGVGSLHWADWSAWGCLEISNIALAPHTCTCPSFKFQGAPAWFGHTRDHSCCHSCNWSRVWGPMEATQIRKILLMLENWRDLQTFPRNFSLKDQLGNPESITFPVIDDQMQGFSQDLLSCSESLEHSSWITMDQW